MNASNDTDTDEYLVSSSQTDVLSPQVTSSAVQVDLAALSHQGKPNSRRDCPPAGDGPDSRRF